MEYAVPVLVRATGLRVFRRELRGGKRIGGGGDACYEKPDDQGRPGDPCRYPDDDEDTGADDGAETDPRRIEKAEIPTQLRRCAGAGRSRAARW
jgi:hypothetical protein